MLGEDDISERFIQLETKIAYQEKLISELNDVVLSHTRSIDRLELRVLQLEDLLREQSSGPIGHEKPPHY